MSSGAFQRLTHPGTVQTSRAAADGQLFSKIRRRHSPNPMRRRSQKANEKRQPVPRGKIVHLEGAGPTCYPITGSDHRGDESVPQRNVGSTASAPWGRGFQQGDKEFGANAQLPTTKVETVRTRLGTWELAVGF